MDSNKRSKRITNMEVQLENMVYKEISMTKNGSNGS